MDEIRAIPWNGFNVASTFSGTGGSSLGYRMAGFRVLYASEFVEAARESYKANAADYTVVDDRDIRNVSADDILAAIGMGPGELDLLDGSPPCASFSTAGKREKGWGQVKKYSDTKQRTDDLFFEFARILRGVRPRVFVAENVSGLVKGSAKGYFKMILAELRACGYNVEARLLDAQWLGVPQTRQRIIFVGVRGDLGKAPAFPSPLPYRYTLADACPWIRRTVHDTSGNRSSGEFTNRPVPAITVGVNGVNSRHYQVHVEDESDMARFATGKAWQDLQPGEQSDLYFQLVRAHPDRPVGAITAEGGKARLAGVSHPYECRKFSIAELRRICGFPDDFILTGPYAKQWERLGRSVPPVMMKHIAAAIRDRVLAQCAE